MAGKGDGRVDQRAADPALLQRRQHRHVLDLELIGPARVGELEVTDDLVFLDRDEDAARVDVRIELLAGILRELEQRPQVSSCAGMQLDPHVHHCRKGAASAESRLTRD